MKLTNAAMKPDIHTREDIFALVTRFYAKVRRDELLGPIFNSIVEDWPHHMQRITDFWQRNLLQIGEFNGNPGRTHMQVDDHAHNTLEAAHFERWLALWRSTIDALYEGAVADDAKDRAQRIGQNFLRMIMNHRAHKLSGSTGFRGTENQAFRPEL